MFLKSDFGDPDEIALAAAIRQRRQPTEGGIVSGLPRRLEMPVTIFDHHEPMTDAELDRLGDCLRSCKGGREMSVEQLDGFFAALIAGPETVMPSEYYSAVFGGEMSETCEFGSVEEANDILALMMRHWNTIAATPVQGQGPRAAPAGGRERCGARQRLGSRIFAVARRPAR